MKLSVIIPAYNEEQLLPGCLESVFAALAANALDSGAAEVIVVDNNSTDGTAAVARRRGARVVFEPVNQISRARNAGAAVAAGDWLLFVDADSRLSQACLADLLHRIGSGRVAGGGCLVALDEVPPIGRPFIGLWNLISRTCRWAAGSFVFCRANAFREVGGFNTAVYAAEELYFSRALKRWAQARGLEFVILADHWHISSGRKFRLYSRVEILRHLLRSGLVPWRTLRDRQKLGFFYDGRR